MTRWGAYVSEDLVPPRAGHSKQLAGRRSGAMANMTQAFDLVIRGGKIVDGSGQAPFEGDVAVRADRIVAIGDVAGAGETEIDASGFYVTPGFVDVHTHYDGQVTW